MKLFVRFGILLFLFGGLLFGAVASSTAGLLAGSFLSGLLLTFTPCVLPMVPIVSSIIAGQGENLTKMRAFVLSLSYVLGTAATYAVMGALAGATGEQLQAYFQNVWAIGIFSLIFVLMALSMFGLFTIQLPASIQSKLDARSRSLKGGSVVMVFLLGMISALILGACVSPVLISFLGVAITAHDAVLGALTMFALALGMGVPLIVVGLGAGTLIPKAGGWMEEVKHFFGILLLGVAVFIFSELGIVSELLLWGLFLVGTAVMYLKALEPLGNEFSAWKITGKGAGVILLIWGTILLVGAAKGHEDLWHPLKEEYPVYAGNGAAVPYKSPFTLVRSMSELDAKRKEALREGKPVVLFFYSDTCSVCKKMKATTLRDPKVRRMLAENFVALRVNITDPSDEKSMKIKHHYKVFGTPAFVFIDKNGKIAEDEMFYGYQTAEEFYDTLDFAQ